MLQIGYGTQVAFIMLLVGLYLAFRPYNIAHWHANDETVQQRLHKREQGHKKKNQRTEYKRQENVQPTPLAVKAFRGIGVVLTIAGLLIGIWSLRAIL